MGFAQWLRVIDAAAGLVQMSSRLRRGEGETTLPATGGALGQLEQRLAGVVVAALKEAFDRDRARMDLERTHLEAERARAEAALRAELRRQAADRSLTQLRMIAVMAVGVWMVSAALGVWLPGMGGVIPRTLLGAGWVSSIGALGCSFAAWQHVSAWSAASADEPLPSGSSDHAGAKAAPWLLLLSLALTGAALLAAL